MPLIKVVDTDGVEHEVQADAGRKLMEILRELDFGVAAICGGMCSCATCHVYIDPTWAPCLHDAMPEERDLLRELSQLRPDSRLSCQIEVTPALAGLKVTIAPEE